MKKCQPTSVVYHRGNVLPDPPEHDRKHSMLEIGAAAPAIDGIEFSRPTLLAFFETDCPACQLTLPYLNALQAAVEEKAVVAAISQDSDCRTETLAKALPIEIPIHIDHRLTASRAYDPLATPTLFLVDRRQRIAARSTGFDKTELNRIARRLCDLAGVPVTAPAAPHDGNPQSKPGCTSRHLEPESGAADPDPVDVHAQRGQRAGRAVLPDSEDPYEYCYEHGFADPLPVVPPTVERVQRMLAASGLPPREIIARIPPNFGAATVEKIAANAVMAGCKPEMMRVLVPLTRAMCDERLDIHGVQGTTHFAAPLVIVNGPVRGQLGFASGSNVFSNVARANSTLGRAAQLMLRNLGGAIPGEIDMSTLGNPGKFSYVIAENEEAGPWAPLCVDFGIDPRRSALTLYCCEPPRGVSEHTARSGAVLLRAFCPVLANLWSRRVCRAPEALVVIGPEHAATLKRSGFSKDDVIDYLYENTGIPAAEYDDDGGEGSKMTQHYEECVIRSARCYRKFKGPESIRVVVAGGPAGKFSAVLGSWQTGKRGSQMVSYPIDDE